MASVPVQLHEERCKGEAVTSTDGQTEKQTDRQGVPLTSLQV